MQFYYNSGIPQRQRRTRDGRPNSVNRCDPACAHCQQPHGRAKCVLGSCVREDAGIGWRRQRWLRRLPVCCFAAGSCCCWAHGQARALAHCYSVCARSPRIRTPPVAQRRALLPAIPRRKPFAGGNFAGWGAGRGGGGWCRQSVGHYHWVLRCVGRSRSPPWQHGLHEIAFFRAPHDRCSGLHSHPS